MEKLNIAELIKDCPEGMELDCVMFEKPVKYMGLTNSGTYIKIKTSCDGVFYLTKEGYLHNMADSKCIIFPKGKTTWEGFHRPFKDGDVVATSSGAWISITTGSEKGRLMPTYCVIQGDDTFEAYLGTKKKWYFSRLATEEEKARLFQAIKDNGYKWNAEPKTLEKLIEPKFKVGDRIIKNDETYIFNVVLVSSEYYTIQGFGSVYEIPIKEQDDYELVPNKFDITTLKPFDKVLVRTKRHHDEWISGFFSHKDSYEFAPFWTTADKNYQQCIPYEGNEHLLGTTNDCDDFYKTWES